ncbi:MAG: hypothetical protein AB7N76_06595 [Planctomycetota bacterium]
MEDPVRFAAWCEVRPGHAAQAADAVVARQPGVSLLGAKKRANRALAAGEPVLLAPALGWDEASALRAAPPAWAGALTLFQEGYGPSPEAMLRCERHDLFHAGSLGCPVCTGLCAR